MWDAFGVRVFARIGRWAEKAPLCARLPGERCRIAGLGGVRAPGGGLGGRETVALDDGLGYTAYKKSSFRLGKVPMPEQKRVTGGQREDKQPQERKLEPATEQAVERAAPAAWPGGPPLPPDDVPLQAMAARLSDTRFQTAQRMAMAARVGSLAGNAVLQRMIARPVPRVENRYEARPR